MPCPSTDDLQRLASAQLPSGDAERVQAHLGGCSECSIKLFELAVARPPVDAATRPLSPNFAPPALNSPAAVPRAPRLERGASVGRYLVVGLLGEGGMGVVYAAYDPELDRKVAIKLLQVTGGATEGVRTNQAQLLREAQAMARLTHPNVIAVHDVGSLEGDRVFVAMELVEGPSLRQWMEERPRPWQEVLKRMRQAGAGLAAAHAAGLVHRDFKPDNVLCGNDGRARVLDFGLAHAVAAPAPASSGDTTTRPETAARSLTTPLTRAELLMGTPPYMAPEQYRGEAADPRTDQFSFGVALHEALYGVRPFAGRYAERPEQAKWSPVDPPKGRTVPAWLRKIILRCLAVEPAQRFPSMDALLAALAKDPAVLRRRVLVGAGALCLLALGAGVVRAVDRREAQLCRGAEQKLTGIWDARRQSDIALAFTKTGKAGAAESWSHAQRPLEAYAIAWSRMRTEACEATRVRGEQSEAVMELRLACLDRRLGELAALSDVLAQADADVVGKAIQAASGLTDLSGCADLATLTAKIPPPPAKDAAELATLSSRLARAKALFESGKVKEGAAQASEVLERARALGYRPLVGRAQAQLGAIQAGTSDPAGPATLREAVWTASAVHDDETAARAAVGLLHLVANMRALDEAAKWQGLAEASVDRLGRPDRLEAPLLIAQSAYRMRMGQPAQGVELTERAIAILKKFVAPDSLPLASAYNALAAALDSANREADALAAHRQALAIREKTLGQKATEVGISLMNIGVAEMNIGKVDDAHRDFSRADDIFLETTGPESYLYALNGYNDAESLMAMGKLAEAKRHLQLSHAIWEKTQGADSDAVAMALDDLALVAIMEQQWSVALDDATRSLARRTKSVPPGHPDLAKSLAGLGAAELGLGKNREALNHLEQAVAINQKSSVPLSDAAEATFALAAAIAANHGDPVRSQKLAASALEDFAKSGRPLRRKAVEDWLAEHPVALSQAAP